MVELQIHFKVLYFRSFDQLAFFSLCHSIKGQSGHKLVKKPKVIQCPVDITKYYCRHHGVFPDNILTLFYSF